MSRHTRILKIYLNFFFWFYDNMLPWPKHGRQYLYTLDLVISWNNILLYINLYVHSYMLCVILQISEWAYGYFVHIYDIHKYSGVLSPALFTVYKDGLLKRLEDSGVYGTRVSTLLVLLNMMIASFCLSHYNITGHTTWDVCSITVKITRVCK